MSECNCRRDDYLPTPPLDPDCPCPPPRPLPPMPSCPPRPCPPDPCQNRTPNYGLPLWKASDVTSWLMQMNGAMLRIDNIMHDLALRTGINGLPDDLVTSVSKLCQDVGVLNCTVGELANKQANQDLLMQNMNTQFSAMKTDIASLQLSITNLDTRVMTVDSANQQNRNDITLIKSDLNMLSKTVTNLSSNLSQYQNATNQTLAEHTEQIAMITEDIQYHMYHMNASTMYRYYKIGSNPDNVTVTFNMNNFSCQTFGPDIRIMMPQITSITCDSAETFNDYICFLIDNPELNEWAKKHTCTNAISTGISVMRTGDDKLLKINLCVITVPAEGKDYVCIYIDPLKNNRRFDSIQNSSSVMLNGLSIIRGARSASKYTPEEMYEILLGNREE